MSYFIILTQCTYQTSKNKLTEEVHYQISRRISHVATTRPCVGLLSCRRLPSEPCHHRSKRLPLLLKDRHIGNTVPLATCQHLLTQLLHRPYQHIGHLQDLLRRYPQPRSHRRGNELCYLLTLIRQDHLSHQDLQLQVIEPLPCSLTHPLDLLCQRLGRRICQFLSTPVRTHDRTEADNRRLPCRHREHTLAAATNQNRRMRSLHRLGE